MPFDKDSIRTALVRIPFPGTAADIVSAGALAKVAYCDGYCSIRIAAANLTEAQRANLQIQIATTLRVHAQESKIELADLHIDFSDEAPVPVSPSPHLPHSPSSAAPGHRPIPIPPAKERTSNALPGVKHILAVGAGKGGVGKSTVALNLAVGLARKGHAVGLMDGDIYGPSMPTMLGLSSMDVNVRGSTLAPFFVHGVKAMTIGKLVEPDKPLIWRGPMAHGAFKQLVEQTDWGDLDYLIIDLPPGTGDVALTMAQILKLTGAIVVCTPQKVAQDDAIRAARMFQQLGIDVLGVVENMSFFVGDDGKEYDIFGRGGAQLMAQRLGVSFLGALPITMSLRENSDNGDPTANFTDTSPRNAQLHTALGRLVDNIENQVALTSIRSGAKAPTLSIS